MTFGMFECEWDENLQEIPVDRAGFELHGKELRLALSNELSPENRINLLGELGTLLRILRHLDEAEQTLREALRLLSENHFGIRKEVQLKIKLAHVLQWRKDYSCSNSLFDEVLEICRTNSEAEVYLDFALQHAAKNQFDQLEYKAALQMFKDALFLRKQRKAPSDQIESSEYAIKITKSRLGIGRIDSNS